MTADQAYGAPVLADDQWVAAKKELYPAPSLARVASHARSTVGAVSVVGAVLTLFGLVTATSATTVGPVRWLALAASGLAVAAILLCLWFLALRTKTLNTEDLAQVKAWYGDEFAKIWRVQVATYLLLLALILASVSVVMQVLNETQVPTPVVTLSATRSGESYAVEAVVSMHGLDPGVPLGVSVVDAEGNQVISVTSMADGAGSLSVQSKADTVKSAAYTCTVSWADQEMFEITVAP